MYTITLSNGMKLEHLELNGNNFISQDIIEDSVFENGLDVITISNGETIETYTNMRLMSNRIDNGVSWFVLGEISQQEFKDIKINAKIDYIAMMADVDMEV